MCYIWIHDFLEDVLCIFASSLDRDALLCKNCVLNKGSSGFSSAESSISSLLNSIVKLLFCGLITVDLNQLIFTYDGKTYADIKVVQVKSTYYC